MDRYKRSHIINFVGCEEVHFLDWMGGFWGLWGAFTEKDSFGNQGKVCSYDTACTC